MAAACVSTFRVFLRKFGSSSGSESFPAQRVYIFSEQVWDTELLFVSSKGLIASMACRGSGLAAPIIPLP